MLDSISKQKVKYMLDRHPIDANFSIDCKMVHGVFPLMHLKCDKDETFIFVSVGDEAKDIANEVLKIVVDFGRKTPIINIC
jgi:hypothetical protein